MKIRKNINVEDKTKESLIFERNAYDKLAFEEQLKINEFYKELRFSKSEVKDYKRYLKKAKRGLKYFNRCKKEIEKIIANLQIGELLDL